MDTGAADREADAEAAAKQAVLRQSERFFTPGGWRCIWLSATGAFVFGAVALSVAIWGANADARNMVEWDVLLAILVAQGTVWGLFIPRAHSWHDDIAPLANAAWKPGHGRLQGLSYQHQSLIVAVFVAVVLGATAILISEVLEPSRTNVAQYAAAGVLTVLGGLVWYQIVVVMRACYVATRLAIFEPAVAARTELRAVLGAERLLSSRLRAVLAAVGGMLTVLVLAASATVQVANALRRADADTRTAPGADVIVDEIPSTVVLLFGVALTGILVMVYLPTHIRMASVRQYIIDGYYPLTDTALERALDGRAKLAAEIGESSPGFDVLQRSAVIVGPLLAGLASSFLGA